MTHRPVQHAFTVDVEDWHQGIPIDAGIKESAAWRLEHSLATLLSVLGEANIKATFFWLGPAAQRHPTWVREMMEAGHEVGTHGWSHDLVYDMTPDRFREETNRAASTIAEITGREVTAYRAAYFSITRKSMWAFEVLAGLGFRYDSSIFPIRNWRYGIPDFSPVPQRLDTPAGPMYELPISVRRVLGLTIPVSGGAYFRLYPYSITRTNIRAAERDKRPVVFYIHPWELDVDHPRLRFHWRARVTHYANLATTERKLRRLVSEFSFRPLGAVLENEARLRGIGIPDGNRTP